MGNYSRLIEGLSTSRGWGILRVTLVFQTGELETGPHHMNKDVQGLIYGASIVSIITAIYMYATGKKDTGIFIGLWAPTFLSLGTFFNTEYRAAKDEATA